MNAANLIKVYTDDHKKLIALRDKAKKKAPHTTLADVIHQLLAKK